jgi:hypothetical protein
VVILRIISAREKQILAGILLLLMQLVLPIRNGVSVAMILEQFLLENTAVCMITNTNVTYLNVYTERRKLEEVSASEMIQERINICMLENTNTGSIKYEMI